MGMNLSTYVVMGIKKTRQEWKDYGIDYGCIEENNPGLGLAAIQGEGSDDVIIGKILAENNEYGDQIATELIIPSEHEIWAMLSDAEVAVIDGEVKLYFYGVWGCERRLRWTI